MCTRTMKQTNKMLNTLLITFLFYKAVFSKSVKGLYGKNDNVFILNSSNFDRNVVGSKSIWVVEFYNSWCGHCISFAPTWKEFAAEKIDWWPVVQIGAVNCAAEENTNLCRQYDVRGFPVFKLFAPMHKENSTVETFYEQNKSEIETKIVDFLSSESVLAPDDWPRLSPIKSMEHIWDEAKDEHHHVAFVFEDEQSNIGTQVILDTLKYRPLLVRRMLHGAVEKFGVTTIPALFLINRDGTFTNLAKTDNSRESMVKALTGLLSPAQLESGKKSVEARKAFLQNELLNILGNDEDSPDTNENLEDQKKPAVYMRDLESTLYYAFRQEIPLCQQISDVRLAALKTFVAALVQYFPGEPELEGFLEKLWAWLQTVKSGITGEDWLNKIDQLQTVDAYLPCCIKWVGCAGSEPRFRGYPCGMWTLFHTLTVGAAQHDRQNPKELPIDVLAAIVGYMKHFFGCETCVKHFLGMAKNTTSGDHTPNGAVLWLWQAHNKVNARLHGDKTEDPAFPKIQFPSKNLCQDCHIGVGEPDKNSIFHFLLSFYGRSGIIVEPRNETGTSRELGTVEVSENKDLDWWELHQRKKDLDKIRDLRKKKRSKDEARKEMKLGALVVAKQPEGDTFDKEVQLEALSSVSQRYHWDFLGFSNVDMSLCVVFYVLCTLGILALYYHFIVRRKYRPCKISTHNKFW